VNLVVSKGVKNYSDSRWNEAVLHAQNLGNSSRLAGCAPGLRTRQVGRTPRFSFAKKKGGKENENKTQSLLNLSSKKNKQTKSDQTKKERFQPKKPLVRAHFPDPMETMECPLGKKEWRGGTDGDKALTQKKVEGSTA